MTTIIQKIESAVITAGEDVINFLETVVKEEVEALAPIVEAAIPTIIADAGALGTPAGWITAVAAVGLAILPKLESVGASVAGASVLTAIGTGLAKVAASAGVTPGGPAAAPADPTSP